MSKIFKYKLLNNLRQDVEMPIRSEILSVQFQQDQLYLWAKVNPDNQPEIRKIVIVGTGFEFDSSNLTYIATIQEAEGLLIWHVFEDEKK